MDWKSAWRGRRRFVLFDSAFGDGERFQALVRTWRDDLGRPASLHVIAHSDSLLPGQRRVLQPLDGITLDLVNGPLHKAVGKLAARLDGAWLHGHEGETVCFVRALARLAEPGMLLLAQHLSAAQAADLNAAGFELDAGPQAGVFRGRFHAHAPARAFYPAERRIVVVGAGLAGTALCERLCARGWHVTLVEQHAHPAHEASGNLAGIMLPLLARDDNLAARFSRAAYLFAQAYLERVGGVGPGGLVRGARCGVLQLARDAEHAEAQRRIAAEQALPPDLARWLEADEVAAMLAAGAALADGAGASATAPLRLQAAHGAWLFPRGGWVAPPSLCGAMLTACGQSLIRRFASGAVHLEREEGAGGAGQWRVCDAGGEVLASSPQVVLATGNGARTLAHTAHLPLASVRGQVTHLAEPALAPLGLVLCREGYVTPSVGGVHCVGATYDSDADPELRAASQAANLAMLRELFGAPALGATAPLAGRVGFRCVSPDRLPLVGALPVAAPGERLERLRDVPRQPGLSVLLGLASRGLTWAPLAAELLAAQLEGEPLPVERDLADALDPARFQLKAARRA
jgi:tRNA 5-methylaminomethyl-2-thiouridine biosynthesis bifunctional protein